MPIEENVLRTLPAWRPGVDPDTEDSYFWYTAVPINFDYGTVPNPDLSWGVCNLNIGVGLQFAAHNDSTSPQNELWIRLGYNSGWSDWHSLPTRQGSNVFTGANTFTQLTTFTVGLFETGLSVNPYESSPPSAFGFIPGNQRARNYSGAPVILEATGFAVKNPQALGTYQNQVTMVFDAEEGTIDVKGGYKVNGVAVGGGSVPDVLELDHQASEPAAPSAGTTKIFCREWDSNTYAGASGKVYLFVKEASGPSYPLQPHNAGPLSRYVQPGTAAAAATIFSAVGVGFTASATTYTQVAISTGSLKSRMRWGRLASSTTAGNVTYVRGNYLECSREGGFFALFRVTLDTLQSGNRGFVGLVASASNPTNIDPRTTASPARVGFGFNANTGNWYAVYSDGSVVIGSDELTITDNSIPVDTDSVIEFRISCAPGASTIYWTATNMSTGQTIDGTFSVRIPGNTTGLTFQAWMSNNAQSAAVAFSVNRIYLETPY